MESFAASFLIFTSSFIYVHLFMSSINAFFLVLFYDLFHLLFSIYQHFSYCVCVLLCSVSFHLVIQSRGEPELRSSVSGSSTTETHTALPIKALSLLLTDSLKLTDTQVKTEVEKSRDMDHSCYVVHFHAHIIYVFI